MKKFIVLYVSSVTAEAQMAKSTPEQGKTVMDAWMAWVTRARSSIVDMGAPLGNGTKLTPTASGAPETKVAGFSILQAESRDALLDIMRSHPHFMAPGAAIEVQEFLPIPGM